MCIRDRSDFNIDNMLTTMRQYYRGGRYDFLLNSTENIDLLGKRFCTYSAGTQPCSPKIEPSTVQLSLIHI